VRFPLLLLLTFPALVAAETYSISGIVVQHGSGGRVPHALVSISTAEGRPFGVPVSSGKEGQFSFTGLAAGKYLLTAEFRGHSQRLQEHEGFSTSIAAGPGLDSGHIVFALDAVAALRGTVRDEAGDPVANAQLTLFQRAIVMGRPKVKLVPPGAMTDAGGDFRFRNLAPGNYFVAAQGHPWFAQYQPRGPNPEQLDVAYPLTYYADSTNPAEATTLILKEGATAEVHLTLRATPAVHIKLEGGAVVGAPQFSQEGPGGIEVSASGMVFFGSPEQREVSGLTPGHYLIRLQTPNEGRAITLSEDTALNLDDVLRSAATSISGRVTLTDGPPAQTAAVWLVNVASESIRGSSRGFVLPDGAFRFDPPVSNSPPPGRYELGLSGGLYMKSVSVKGAEYSRGELEVREGSQIQISMTAGRAGDFAGVVTKDGQPFGGAMVLLIPQDFSHGAAIPRDQSDSDGTFKMASVAPGAYTLLAIEEPGELEYHDPAAIAPYLKQGRTLQLPLAPDTQTKVEVQRQIP
jgi:hypothetical protein